MINGEGHRLDRGSAWAVLQRLGRLAELSRPLSAHQLRTTGITELLRSANVQDVAAFARHSHVSTTIRYDRRAKSLDGHLSYRSLPIWAVQRDRVPAGHVLLRPVAAGARRPRADLDRSAQVVDGPTLQDGRSMAPWGLFDVEDPAEFRRRYCHRLHRFAPRIIGQLEELTARYPGTVLVLMCFERRRRDCHRGELAEWLSERLSVEVPEID